ncbi:MAG: hypothetical protein ABRQ29_08230, partial [Smithellaceae bacterium]
MLPACCPDGCLWGLVLESVLTMNPGETKDQRLQLSGVKDKFCAHLSKISKFIKSDYDERQKDLASLASKALL